MLKRIILFVIFIAVAVDVEALPPNSLLKFLRKTRGHLQNVDLEKAASRLWDEIKKGPPNDPREVLDHINNLYESDYKSHARICGICGGILRRYDFYFSEVQREAMKKEHKKRYSGC